MSFKQKLTLQESDALDILLGMLLCNIQIKSECHKNFDKKCIFTLCEKLLGKVFLLETNSWCSLLNGS